MAKAHLKVVVAATVILAVSAYAGEPPKGPGSCLVQTISALVPRSAKQALREAKARQLAGLIAVDEETQKLVSNPEIAQYIYLNYFADKTGQNELRVALQDIVDSDEAGQHDLYELVNQKMESRLNDPQVQAKVRAAFEGDDAALRPGRLRARAYTMSSKAKQMFKFPETVSRLKKLTDEGFSRETMDQGLFDFYGATQLGLKESQLRPWESIPGSFSAIRPGQIENISPELWVQMAHFASETEMPIHGYSTTSGDALRGMMPSLSAFMGKTTEEERAYEAAHAHESVSERRYGFCTNVWCREENRHELAVQRIAEHVSGQPNSAAKTYSADPPGDYSSPEYALKHLAGRNSSEWNANSIYLYLRAHSSGAANRWIDNVRRDETKHMAIFSTAYKYFFGTQLNKRTREMLDKIMALKKAAAVANSNGSLISSAGAPTLFEMAVTHLFVEKNVRDYMKSVPLKTMEKLFDSPVKTIAPLESAPVPLEKQKVIDEMVVRERENRAKLARWTPDERAKYLALKKVEKEQGALIESLIAHLFDDFRGAEVPGSPREKEVLAQIAQLRTGLDPETNSLVQMSLRETLRDYQIMNNSFVRNKRDLVVRLKNAQEGFVVEHQAPDQARVLLSQRVNDSSYLIRVEKPSGMEFKPGDAVRITLDTPNGRQFRTLSLASSPSRDYLEFAVRDSESDFKKAFTSLKPGTSVRLEPAKGVLNFKPEAPAVMIAGGIGITPFRSIIEFAKDQKLDTPMWLFYGNRDQIAFKNELDENAANLPKFNVTHVLSKPDSAWTGERGRVDEAFLKRAVPGLPENSQYYVVGPPPMVMDAQAALTRLGIPKERISIEIFPESSAAHSAVKGESAAPSANEDPKICFCHSVTRSRIQEAVRGGATTLADIQAQTMAATGCGGCECNVMGVLQCELKRLGRVVN